jgi:hypothetical protein
MPIGSINGQHDGIRYAQGLDNNSNMADGTLDHRQVGGTNMKGCGNLNTKGIKIVSCEMVFEQNNANVGGKERLTKLAILECGKVGISINVGLCEVIVWQNNLGGNVEV